MDESLYHFSLGICNGKAGLYLEDGILSVLGHVGGMPELCGTIEVLVTLPQVAFSLKTSSETALCCVLSSSVDQS